MPRSARSAWLILALVAAGCGGKSHEECPAGKHSADPDGRGERCIDDRSTCDAAGECTTQDACCTASCGDPEGDGIYQCGDTCRTPECTPGSCEVGWRCQPEPADACAAFCVPEGIECLEGFILADPTGSGVFVCVAMGSECLQPTDCPDSADGCCTGSCTEQAGDVWACALDCGAGGEDSGAPAEDEAMFECATDLDCENAMGQPGWTCEQIACGANECIPPGSECNEDGDCVLAIDLMNCCPTCPLAYSLDEIEADPCLWVRRDDGDREGEPPADPISCTPDCTDVPCLLFECMPPSGAGCQQGQCVVVF